MLYHGYHNALLTRAIFRATGKLAPNRLNMLG